MKQFFRSGNIPWMVGIVCFTALLLGYAIQGTHSRYLADDYCYGTEIQRQGFFNTQIHSYFNLTPYSSNRYSLTFFSTVFEVLGGPRLTGYLPGLAILLWVWGSVYALRQTGKLFGRPFSWMQSLCMGSGLVFFALYLAPNRYQILYWRSGMLPYLAPLIANTALLGWVIERMQKGSVKAWHGLGLFLLAFVAAGFSETAGALQTTAVLLALGFAMIALMRRKPKARVALQTILPVLAGTLIGMAGLILSPTNAIRQSGFPTPPDLVTLAEMCYHNTVVFLYLTFHRFPSPFIDVANVIGIGCVLAWVYRQGQAQIPSGEKVFTIARLGRFALLIPIVFILCAAVMAPTAWSMSSYPEDRGLLIARAVIVAAAGLAGWWGGEWVYDLAQRYRAGWVRIATLPVFLLAVILLVYPLRTVGTIVEENRALTLRSGAWDVRDQLIQVYRDRGETDLVVPALDSIARIFELQDNGSHWVNNCAATYYGVNSIRAIEP